MLRIYGQNGSSTELTEVGKGQHSVLVRQKIYWAFSRVFNSSFGLFKTFSTSMHIIRAYYVLQSL